MSKSDTGFQLLKRADRKTALDDLYKKSQISDTETRERPMSKSYNAKVLEALVSVGNTDLYSRIQTCSNHPSNIGKRYYRVCQSPWCTGCRNHLYLRHYSKVHERLTHGRHIKTDYEIETPLLFTETEQRFSDQQYTNNNLRHITGVVGLCPVRTADLQQLIKTDTTKWRRIRRRLNKETDEVYWIECVYEFELVDWSKLLLAPESDYKKQQMRTLIEHSGERYSREPFLFVHWHGLTNMRHEQMKRVFSDDYWLKTGKTKQRIPKTNPDTGLYIQGLHKDKSLQKNIAKITSYPFKNPTRYKHSYIGSDYKNGEFFTPEELGQLMTIYDDAIGRQGRTMFRSMGNDADVWHDVLDTLIAKAKSAKNKRQRRELREFHFFISDLLQKVRKKGAGNLASKITPLITDEQIQRKLRKPQNIPWEFKPIALTRKEEKMIRRYQTKIGDFSSDIDHTWLRDTYRDIWQSKSKVDEQQKATRKKQ